MKHIFKFELAQSWGVMKKEAAAFAHPKKKITHKVELSLLIGKVRFPSFWSETVTPPQINIPKLPLCCY